MSATCGAHRLGERFGLVVDGVLGRFGGVLADVVGNGVEVSRRLNEGDRAVAGDFVPGARELLVGEERSFGDDVEVGMPAAAVL